MRDQPGWSVERYCSETGKPDVWVLRVGGWRERLYWHRQAEGDACWGRQEEFIPTRRSDLPKHTYTEQEAMSRGMATLDMAKRRTETQLRSWVNEIVRDLEAIQGKAEATR